MRRTNRRSGTIARAALALIALFLAACSEVKVAETSPDGRYVAQVRSRWSIDPPAESLWAGKRGEPLQRVKVLGEDSQWCNRIEWSKDSTSVTFHIESNSTATTYVSRMQ